eukprot:TRINITY_DN5341_c0_g1_i4.p1 TRINITY_DN5341_c0_g1~~TRINITY_DN5341_c0_g1_i4.p1  ORF type:complete len:126 (+),score=31.74 TRINITY_DN5341_c0_g1_i4:94-471(+)
MEAMFENILSINKSASKYFNEEMLQDKSFTEGYVNFSSDLFEAYSFITSKSLFDPILLFSEQQIKEYQAREKIKAETDIEQSYQKIIKLLVERIQKEQTHRLRTEEQSNLILEREEKTIKNLVNI